MLNQLKPPDMGHIRANEQKLRWTSTFETLAASTMITILLAIGLLGGIWLPLGMTTSTSSSAWIIILNAKSLREIGQHLVFILILFLYFTL